MYISDIWPLHFFVDENLFALIFDTIYDSYQQKDIAKERNEIDYTFEREKVRFAIRERHWKKHREISRNYEIQRF